MELIAGDHCGVGAAGDHCGVGGERQAPPAVEARSCPCGEAAPDPSPWIQVGAASPPRVRGGSATSAYELGPASKRTLSTSSDAFLRNVAIWESGIASGLRAPQLATRSDVLAVVVTGYSPLPSA